MSAITKSLLAISLILTVTYSCSAQCKYRFIINKQNYFVEEKALNDMFGIAFDELTQTGRADARKFQMWANTFTIYKENACQGTYHWDIYHDKILNIRYESTVANNFRLGIDEKGKSATGNANKEKNVASRMALINNRMGSIISRTVLKVDVK